jgi:hypothetical protein
MLITHIVMTYMQISQPNLDNNLTNFDTSIDPSLPIAVYMRKQEKCQVSALNVGVPIFDAMMVTTGTKHALTCGNMTLVWREWMSRPIVDHSWTNWKLHWTVAFLKMHDINCMTAGKATFGANAVEEAHQAHQIAS